MAKCNFCTLKSIKEMKGKHTIVPAPKEGFPNGVDVFIKYPNGDVAWIAWFANLTDHCVC